MNSNSMEFYRHEPETPIGFMSRCQVPPFSTQVVLASNFDWIKLAERSYISHPPGRETNSNYWWINIRPF